MIWGFKDNREKKRRQKKRRKGKKRMQERWYRKTNVMGFFNCLDSFVH